MVSGGSQAITMYVYATTVPIDSSKTVASVTFPDISNSIGSSTSAMHIFAVATGYAAVTEPARRHQLAGGLVLGVADALEDQRQVGDSTTATQSPQPECGTAGELGSIARQRPSLRRRRAQIFGHLAD